MVARGLFVTSSKKQGPKRFGSPPWRFRAENRIAKTKKKWVLETSKMVKNKTKLKVFKI